ncbi:hypothetical protein MPH_08936 [Macrophomina phaseolina MS6]|uniref:Uncharacterized protein n=1 Tax=Macrophomina phaseolina (strain MS6) TaxID=1126212 RepID=K2RM94_MACPH|nr:hypothetical protein MPH_08936 [Macrophomina phaseolina MS6]
MMKASRKTTRGTIRRLSRARRVEAPPETCLPQHPPAVRCGPVAPRAPLRPPAPRPPRALSSAALARTAARHPATRPLRHTASAVLVPRLRKRAEQCPPSPPARGDAAGATFPPGHSLPAATTPTRPRRCLQMPSQAVLRLAPIPSTTITATSISTTTTETATTMNASRTVWTTTTSKAMARRRMTRWMRMRRCKRRTIP